MATQSICDLCRFGHDEVAIRWVQPFSLTPNRQQLEERLTSDEQVQQQMVEHVKDVLENPDFHGYR